MVRQDQVWTAPQRYCCLILWIWWIMKVHDQNTESVMNSALTVLQEFTWFIFLFKGSTACKITTNFNIALSSTRLQSANTEHLYKNIKTLKKNVFEGAQCNISQLQFWLCSPWTVGLLDGQVLFFLLTPTVTQNFQIKTYGFKSMYQELTSLFVGLWKKVE